MFHRDFLGGGGGGGDGLLALSGLTVSPPTTRSNRVNLLLLGNFQSFFGGGGGGPGFAAPAGFGVNPLYDGEPCFAVFSTIVFVSSLRWWWRWRRWFLGALRFWGLTEFDESALCGVRFVCHHAPFGGGGGGGGGSGRTAPSGGLVGIFAMISSASVCRGVHEFYHGNIRNRDQQFEDVLVIIPIGLF